MKILYVEDDSQITGIAKSLFLQTNYKFVFCNTISDSIHVVNKCGDNISVIILDLVLPDSTGIDLLQHLYKSNQKIPVIITTGFIDPFYEQLKPFIENGIIMKILNKPFGLAELMSPLKEIASNKTD